MLKRLVAVLTTVLLAVGLSVGVAAPASAHTPSVTAACSSLTVKFTAYGSGTSNKLTVTIDGTVVESVTFGNDFAEKTYTFSGDVSHSYVVEVDAQHNDHDRTVAKGNAFTGTTSPCTTSTECLNPMSQLKGFTIVTEGDFRASYQGAHVEGTLAVGGDLIVDNRYTTQANHDGTPIPVVEGQSTGLLVGGEATLKTSGQAFFVMSGVARIGDVPSSAAVKEGGKRYHPVSGQDRYVETTAVTTLDQIKAPGLFASTFPNLFANLRTDADEIAAYTSSDVQFVTMSNSPNGGKQVALTSGVTNVLRVSGSTLSGAGVLWFAGGVVPSASTPFIIDVTDSGSVNVTAPVLRNIDEEYVLWNFAKATSLGLSTNEFVKGSVLAPRAALSVNSGGIEGQIAAKSVVIKSVGELHHITYKPCATTPTPVTVTTAPSATAPTCVADGKLVLPAIANITWSGATNGAGPGTYTVTATANPGYTLTGQSSWTITVAPKGDGVNCVEAVQPTLTVAQCDAATGALVSAFITIPTTANLAYRIGGGAPFTPGQKVGLAAGTHVVDVVATNGFTNTGPSSFTIVVPAFDCNKAVAPAVTSAQCDAAGDLVPGFITIPSTTPGLEYRIAGVNGGAPLSGTVSLAAGSYTVTVTAKPGYTNTGPSSFPITIAALDCQRAVEPALTLAVCDATTGLFRSAFATIPSTTPGLEYRISTINGGTPVAGDVNLPAGTYTVTVTAKAGVINTGPSSFTLVVPALECERAVEPTLTVAQCDATTGALTSAFVTIPSTTPGLEYRIAGINGGAPLSGTVNLPAGTYTVTVTAKPGVTNTGASSFPVTVAALGCERAVEPTLTVAQCDATTGAVQGATLTATTSTPKLTYTIRGGAVLIPGVPVDVVAGSYIIDVTAAAGWTNTGSPSFTIDVADLDCTEAVAPTVTAGQCDATTGPVSGFVTIPTTTPGLVYSIAGTDYAAGAEVELPAGVHTVDVRALPGWTNTGEDSFEVTIAAVDCVEEDVVQPAVTDQSCDADLGGTKDGSLLFTLNPALTYTLGGQTVTGKLVSGVAPGTYTVTVTPKPGHYLKGGVGTFEVTVKAAVDCDPVYTTPLDPFANPEICDPQSTGKLDGSITIVHLAGIQWYIATKADGSDKVAVGDATTTGSQVYAKPAGQYYVFAESQDPSIAIKPGHEMWPVEVGFPSQLCTLGHFDPSATASPAVCTATGDPRGTITVDIMDGVSYAFKDGAAITTATTLVAPGSYTVVATPDDPRSTLSEDEWVLTVAAPGILCDLETLALTGQTPAGAALAAILLLQAGLALVAVRFVQRRRARHVA